MMESYWLMNEAGKARHADMLREAFIARRFLNSNRVSKMPAILKSLLTTLAFLI